MGPRRWNSGQQPSRSVYLIACFSLHTWESLRHPQSSMAKIELMGSLSSLPQTCSFYLTGDQSSSQMRNLGLILLTAHFFNPTFSQHQGLLSQSSKTFFKMISPFTALVQCLIVSFVHYYNSLSTVLLLPSPESSHSQSGLS